MTPCRALVPMDTQVLTVIKQLEQRVPLYTLQNAAAAIKATTSFISIDGALSVLKAFNYGNDTFHLKGQKWVAKDLGCEKYFPDLQGRMAQETPRIWFWGGPPTALQWYKGTLQTLLEDRVLYEITVRGAIEVAKWIGTDLSGVCDD